MDKLLDYGDKFQIVEADILIPGRGSPICDGILVFQNDQIMYVGPRDGAPIQFQSHEAIRVPALMPGM
jgi:hypothetical protein